jgi:hypothetical protein
LPLSYAGAYGIGAYRFGAYEVSAYKNSTYKDSDYEVCVNEYGDPYGNDAFVDMGVP